VTPVVIVKFGGELLEDPKRLDPIVAAVARARGRAGAMLIVHGGGKEIDAALRTAGIEKRQVDGLRVTDEATLEVVVAVLGGTVNTRLVAALIAAGVPAVGLTGADGACGLSDPAQPHRSIEGRLVDLGRVGVPAADADMRLLNTLLAAGFVPVIASIGVARDGRLLNVNADTFASHFAGRLGARRLVIAGTTAGVLDSAGATVDVLDSAAIARLIDGGTATAGMIAKLRACKQALERAGPGGDVGDVVIVDGRDGAALEAAVLDAAPRKATRIVSSVAARPA
jgi:acetylglutamate kinase